jgi:hypothetical protein
LEREPQLGLSGFDLKMSCTIENGGDGSILHIRDGLRGFVAGKKFD